MFPMFELQNNCNMLLVIFTFHRHFPWISEFITNISSDVQNLTNIKSDLLFVQLSPIFVIHSQNRVHI